MQNSLRIMRDVGEDVGSELLPPYLPLFVGEIFDFYAKIHTQWNMASNMERIFYIGLDYSSMFQIAKIYKYKLNYYRFAGLQEIEKRYIEKFNKK